MAHRIDGSALAEEITERSRRECATLGFVPTFVAVIVGDNPASHQYVRMKEKACRHIGIAFERLAFAADAPAALVQRAMENLNRRQEVDAVLVQLPLPEHLDPGVIIHALDPQKDADGFHPDNLYGLLNGAPTVIPPLAAGVLRLAKATGEKLNGKRAVVVANSQLFFAPLAVVLGSAGMNVTYAPPDERVAAATATADLVVVAVGKPNFLVKQMLKPGAIVIDVGTNRVNGKTVGDADPSAASIAGHMTPVPGGVGPMTVAMLMHNVIALAKKRRFA